MHSLNSVLYIYLLQDEDFEWDRLKERVDEDGGAGAKKET